MEKVSNAMHLGDGWIYYLCRERAVEEVKPPPITVAPAGIDPARNRPPLMVPPTAIGLVRDPRFQRWVESTWDGSIRYTDSAIAATAFVGGVARHALDVRNDPVDVELALDAMLERFRAWERDRWPRPAPPGE